MPWAASVPSFRQKFPFPYQSAENLGIPCPRYSTDSGVERSILPPNSPHDPFRSFKVWSAEIEVSRSFAAFTFYFKHRLFKFQVTLTSNKHLAKLRVSRYWSKGKRGTLELLHARCEQLSSFRSLGPGAPRSHTPVRRKRKQLRALWHPDGRKGRESERASLAGGSPSRGFRALFANEFTLAICCF